MRIKEIQLTANIAWSPAEQYPIYLAAGTTAQQFDNGTTSHLDLYSLDLSEPGLGMGLTARFPTNQRFHKLLWGSLGIKNGEKPSGIIVGGADQGDILLFDAAKVLSGKQSETGGLLSSTKKHAGPVKALGFNSFQPNLLASGSAKSEIFIWDLNSPNTPMTPGKPSSPLDEVTCLAWNTQVQHILASTYPGRCGVWDLRKNEEIVKVTGNRSGPQIRWKSVAWHPKINTQLCIASEEDQQPIIQLWDLRDLSIPLKTFEGHRAGIQAMDWCTQDPDLLLSCGKDNSLIIWNANNPQPHGEILAELSTSSYCFEASWCPRNPSCIATASLDGLIHVHSIMGGRETAVQAAAFDMIADSFPGMETAPMLQKPQQQEIVHQQLKKAPKWLAPRSGASFGFGGKLVSFGVEPQGTSPTATPQVHVSQVVTEEQLIARSQHLESALHQGNLSEFCTQKSVAKPENQEVWTFLGANFRPSPRAELLKLLGYEHQAASVSDLIQSTEALGVSDAFDTIAAEMKTFNIPTDDSIDGKICKALISGDIVSAVDACFTDKRYAEALILAMTGPAELLTATRDRYFKQMQGDVARLIQSVVTRDWNQVVQHCNVSNWKEALATTLTHADDQEFASLCQAVGQRLESETGSTKEALLCYIIAGNLEKLVECWHRTDDGTTGSLQELVEQVMVLRKAQDHWARPTESSQSSHLTQQLCRYAGLLAGQGNLEAALTYLDLTKDESMVEMKDRLEHALGRHRAAPAVTNGPYAGSNQFSQRQRYPSYGVPKPATPISSIYGHQEQYNPISYPQRSTTPAFQAPSWNQPPANTFNPVAPPASLPPMGPPAMPPQPSPAPPQQFAPPPPAQQFAPAPPAQQYTPPQFAPQPQAQQYAPPQFNPQTSPQAPPSAAQIAPPPAAVAPPPTGTGGVLRGLPSLRSRVYVQDPSLNSGRGGYYTPGANTPFPASGMMGMNQPQQSQQGSQFSTFSQPQFNQFTPAQPASFQPPNLANGTYENTATSVPTFFNPDTMSAPQSGSFAKPAVFDSAPSVTPPPLTAAPVIPVVPVTSAPPGWNDPPPLTFVNKPTIEPVPVEPITQPIIQPMGVVEQPAVPVMQPFDGMQYHGVSHVESIQHSSIPEPAPVAPPAPPAPIPPEHLVIHDVLHSLKDKCSAVAPNPQMKRKIDDVGRKLDILDDLLRKNTLMPNTLNSLHQIVQAVQAGDFGTSLSLHAQVVMNTPFTEIGSFISGLKILLQSAHQLCVTHQ